jgi:hypothetical protein
MVELLEGCWDQDDVDVLLAWSEGTIGRTKARMKRGRAEEGLARRDGNRSDSDEVVELR